MSQASPHQQDLQTQYTRLALAAYDFVEPSSKPVDLFEESLDELQSNMMTSMETITFPSSLLGDDLSIWSNDLLPKNEFQDGASLDTTIQLMDALVACKQDQKSSYLTAGDQNDPLPDWMSEKVDVSNWLDVFAGNSANQMNELEMDRMSPANELLNTFEADESNMSDFFLPKTCLDEEPFMASSPGSSIGSGGSGVNSSVSTMPSSPYSMGSETSEGDSLRETDLGTEDPVSLELLLNTCKDADVFLQLADVLPMDLPLPAEGDLKMLGRLQTRCRVTFKEKKNQRRKSAEASPSRKG
ncbi:hypothetical protein BSL78_05692 [Apostichopus japonicus]|uniref:Uncharacterized protein n=1 Tax=Stichopus japonicus TaxID=307972 RepID=A0A2G8LAY4_STIJA|nr:hypothetical protein BSL78_05692 [Apostichopus japonicus]